MSVRRRSPKEGEPGILPVTRSRSRTYDWRSRRDMYVAERVQVIEMGFGSFVKSVGSAVTTPVSGALDAASGAIDDIGDLGSHLANEALTTTGFAGGLIVDGVTHVVTPVAAAVLDVTLESLDMTYDAAKYLGARGVDMVVEGTALVGPTIELVGVAAEVATLGLGDDVMHAVDDHVLDTIDEATGGIVDLDYDDGGFSVNVGIDDVIGLGLAIGEDGLSAESEVLVGGSYGIGVGDDGLLLEAEGGIDVFPLPYVETHVEIDADGNVDVNGVVQGPVPYPVGGGILAGRVEGGFQKTEEGWMVEGQAEGVWFGADGTQISGQAGLVYGENEDGSIFLANAAGSITGEYGTVSGGASYARIDQDGVVIETFDAEAHASGFGMEAGAGAKYMGVETPEGSESMWETDIDVSGVDPERLMALGAEVLGDDDGLVAAALESDGAAALESDDLLGIDLPEDPVAAGRAAVVEFDDQATIAEPDFTDPTLDSSGFDEVIGGVEPADEPFLAEEISAPIEELTVFDGSIDAADALEDSMDDLFEGLD